MKKKRKRTSHTDFLFVLYDIFKHILIFLRIIPDIITTIRPSRQTFVYWLGLMPYYPSWFAVIRCRQSMKWLTLTDNMIAANR